MASKKKVAKKKKVAGKAKATPKMAKPKAKAEGKPFWRGKMGNPRHYPTDHDNPMFTVALRGEEAREIMKWLEARNMRAADLLRQGFALVRDAEG